MAGAAFIGIERSAAYAPVERTVTIAVPRRRCFTKLTLASKSLGRLNT